MTDLKMKLRSELSPSVILYKPVCFNMDCTEFENHQSSETVSYLEIALIVEYLTPQFPDKYNLLFPETGLLLCKMFWSRYNVLHMSNVEFQE